MRDLSFYSAARTRAPKQASSNPQELTFMNNAWNSEAWKDLIKDYADYPLCIDSQSTFKSSETSIRKKLAEIRKNQLERQLPKETLDNARSSKSARRISYRNPRPYEKICVRISVFGSKPATEAPENFVLVVHFFSQNDQSPITSYIEEVSCILN